MAHRLSNKRTGTVITAEAGHQLIAEGKETDAAMFYVQRERPWHGLGTGVAEAKTAKEALKLSGCDYEVAVGGLQDDDNQALDARKWRLIKRTDKFGEASHLGVVGKKYTLIQNEDAFNILDYIIGKNEALFDTAGALGNGERIWASVRIADLKFQIAGDDIEPYFVITAAHDGTAAVEGRATPIRVVCENTLNMAFAEGRKGDKTRRFKIPHTKNWERKVQEAQKLLGFFKDEYYPKFQSISNKLVAVKRTEKQFEELVNTILHKPDDESSKRAVSIYERKREELFSALHADNLNNVNDRAWGHWQAVTDWSDHQQSLRGDNKDENRFLNTFEATKIKDEAFWNIIKDAKIKVPELVAVTR